MKEEDPGFPSGGWVGFYAYPHGRSGFHRVNAQLEFQRPDSETVGSLTGRGQDDVGPFTMTGGYDVGTRQCWWVKTYPGSHSVSYQGSQAGKMIRGGWRLMFQSGRFAMWPEGEAGISAEFFLSESESTEAPAPVQEREVPVLV